MRISGESMRAGEGAGVDVRRFEQMLERVLQVDYSAGTGAFRDGLLARCLAELDAGSAYDGAELDDDDLGLLAAAGDPDAGGAAFGDGFPMRE